MKSLLRGTFFLAFVLLLSKLFEFIFRMMLNRIAGEKAVGLYMSVYPTFIFLSLSFNSAYRLLSQSLLRNFTP